MQKAGRQGVFPLLGLMRFPARIYCGGDYFNHRLLSFKFLYYANLWAYPCVIIV